MAASALAIASCCLYAALPRLPPHPVFSSFPLHRSFLSGLLSCARWRHRSGNYASSNFKSFSSPSSTVRMEDAGADMDPVQRSLMFGDECILVNERDEVVGHDSKYNCHLMEKIEKEHKLHRAFSVFLFNSQDQLLLQVSCSRLAMEEESAGKMDNTNLVAGSFVTENGQQRSAAKVTFPLVWTNTCCSHPLFRPEEMEEENQQGVKVAAQRKLLDELGIPAAQIPVSNFTCLGRILYKAASDGGKWGEHELDYLLFIKADVDVLPNPNEVAVVKYVDPEGLRELLKKAEAQEEGVKLSPWFRFIVHGFLFQWWERMKAGALEEEVDMENIHRFC
eukprot:TRINITY_DN4717_c0_g1_i5.p1 TRINITY_DN4717_c0_g1~~TRINITY_DN4717_c0_g1_i5.p1  ORF type:complete len:335 (-),score=108.52 TRINITY_DN4717_c0_g1_i5:419-1423(-)